MTRLARRLRTSLATLLAASIVVLSPGLEAPRLFAQVVGRGVPAEGVRALPGAAPVAGPALSLPGSAVSLGATAFSAPSLTAPSVTAPSAFTAAPVAAAPARAASLPAMAKALAPHLEAAAKPETSAAGAATAGREIENVLTGARASGSGDVSATLGAESAGAPALGAYSAASAPADAKPGVPGAPAPVEGKVVATRSGYQLHRFLLKSVAALTGALYSLPIAGPALSQKMIASAADKRVVLSDYDDTLAGYNQVLPEDMVEAVRAIRAAGKDFAVISDRGDEKRPHQLTVFESLASLPVELRAGMYVAANSGGRVYRYDAAGEPVRVFEVPALADDLKAKVAEAATATKARLAEAGTEQHQPSEGNNNPAESWGTYGYAMMLKVGSSKESVVKAGEILQEELAARGMSVEVSPRFAKDPANPPYINFSIVTKAPAAEYIAKALGAKASDVLAIGDNAYAPRRAKKDSWLTRLGAKLSGRDIPATGNMTDRNMEKGVPGALTLSVGHTGDPTASNLWVLSGKGPATTREVLMSVASKPRGPAGPKGDSGETALHLTAVVAVVAAGALGYWAMFHAFGDIMRMGEEYLRNAGHDALGEAMFGGFLSWRGLRSRKGDDLASRYAALESEHAARLSAVPGVVAVKVEDHDFYYGGNLNDTDGKRMRVIFRDVAAFEAGRASLPKELPALEGIKDVARYEVLPEVEPVALAAAYRDLEAGHAASLARTPGVVSVAIGDNPFYYGGTLNDSDGKLATVGFDDLAAYQAALKSLPASLPAIDGVAEVSRYKVVAEMRPKALAKAYASLEDGYRARLSAVPGVVAVRVKDSWHPYGGSDNRMSGKVVTVRFDGVSSLQAAKANGLLPETLPALDGVADVKLYKVDAEVAPARRGWAAYALGAAALIGAAFAAYGWREALDGAAMLGGVLGMAGALKNGPAAKTRTLKESVSPASPIEGFSTFVYAEGLAAAKALAAKAGYRADTLRLTGATLSPRAWGEDWTFSFVSLREDAFKGPNAYSVTVRRTMVSETQLDAIDAKDLGPVRYFTGYPADLVAEAVKVPPMEVVERSGPEARTLALEARWSEAGPARLAWVVRGEKGRELESVDAASGARSVPAPRSALKSALFTLGAIAATVGLYAALYYAFTHAPAAAPSFTVPDGWQGAVPQGGWEILFGGALAAGAAAKGRGPQVTDERVRGAAASVASYKGRPWSHTEYSMAYYNTLESLKKDGATKAQIELFEKLCAEAPIRGGSFNPWSGD